MDEHQSDDNSIYTLTYTMTMGRNYGALKAAKDFIIATSNTESIRDKGMVLKLRIEMDDESGSRCDRRSDVNAASDAQPQETGF